MDRFLLTSALVLAAVTFAGDARADFWVRFDRPWTPREVSQAIAFCRTLPRINPDVTLFTDLVYGKEIQKCMYSLGWVGVAR